METKKNNKRRLKVSDSVFIGILTILGYLIGYFYQVGYVGFYQVPKLFVTDVGIVKVLIGVVSFSTVLWLIIIIHNVIAKKLYPISDRPISKVIRKLYWPILLLVSFSFYLGKSSLSILLTIIIGMVAFSEFIVPIFKYWSVKGYTNKLAAAQIAEEKEGILPKVSVKVQEKLALYVFTVFLFVACSFFAPMIGYSVASKEIEHVIIKDDPSSPKIVIDSYKDKLLVAPVNLDTRVVTPKFKIIDPATSSYEKVLTGPLTLAK